MLQDYTKCVRITKIHSISDEISYDIIYDINTSDITSEANEITDSINVVDRLPMPGDKMYFLNDVTIPRFKIKKFCTDYGTSMVKYIESANLAVIGKDTITKHFISNHMYNVSKDDFKEFLDNKQDECLDNSSFLPNWLSTLVALVEEGVDVYVESYSFRSKLNDNLNVGCSHNGSYINYITADSHIRLQKILNLKCDVIDEIVLLKELNKGVVMDEEIYTNIQNLMDSSDEENLKVSMELMSNCDFDKSAMYLLLLLKKYDKKIQIAQSKHHVNFKALLKYFDLTPSSSFDISVDDIIDRLKKRGILLPDQINILMPLILEEYADSTDKSEHYRVKEVVFLDENGNDIILESGTVVTMENEVAEEILDLDDIVYVELTEVFDYFKVYGPSKFRDSVLEIRHLAKPSENLLPIIKHLDENYQYELATLLTQSYLLLP